MENFVFSDHQLEISRKLVSIRRQIHLSMNAAVVDSMNEKGLVYNQNHGLLLPQLRQIAKQYRHDHALAQQLWALRERETMLLAVMLQPTNTFTPEMADAWVCDIHTDELAEMASRQLFSQLHYACDLCRRWLKSSETWTKNCGFYIASVDLSRWSDGELNVMKIEALNFACEQLTRMSVIVFLKKMVHIKSESQLTEQDINRFRNSDNYNERYVYEELMTEIKYSL